MALPEPSRALSFVSPFLPIEMISSLLSFSSHNGPCGLYEHKSRSIIVPYLSSMFQASNDIGCLTLGHILQRFGGIILIQCAFDASLVNNCFLAIGRRRLPPFCSSKEPSLISEKYQGSSARKAYPSTNDPRRTFCAA